MALFTLETLVLRGLSVVLCDGKSLNLRLGTNGAGYRTTEIDISMRHPTPDPVRLCKAAPWQEPEADLVVFGFDAEVVGAGRLPGVGNRSRRRLACKASRSNAKRCYQAVARTALRAELSTPRTSVRTGTSSPWTRTPPAATS